MAINIKAIIADAFLALCDRKPMSKITIADIQQESGVSRQTFYNHFQDKFDLVQFIYEDRVISLWKSPLDSNLNYYEATLSCFQSDAKYHKFIKQACKFGGTTDFQDFMYEHSRLFDRMWHQYIYGSTPLTEEMLFASDYYSGAKMRMQINWIMEDMPISPEELLENCLRVRLFSLNELLFNGNDARSPYTKAANYIYSSLRPDGIKP